MKQVICQQSDLIKNSGVCALLNVNGNAQQLALFYFPETDEKVFAVSNWDPIGEANVISRGIVGSLSTDEGEQLVVASPLYKQHFDLQSGQCLEQEDVALTSYQASLEGDDVVIEI